MNPVIASAVFSVFCTAIVIGASYLIAERFSVIEQ